MRIATILGLLFTIVIGGFVFLEVSTLQDTGETQGGNLPALFRTISPMFIIIVGVIALGTAVAVMGGILKLMR